tara:strand:+ start:384 stop:1403 length:1020 start_codon:yes stop_codon:yes gene_type:complete
MKVNLKKHLFSKKNFKPLIVAEISANHCGSKRIFLKTIKSAAKNGADLIKIQTYEPKDITIRKFKKNNKLWKLYTKAHTPFNWHKDAFKLAKKLKVNLFSSPFSERAVKFLEKFKVKLYKISSFEITDLKLIHVIAKTKKPVIVSTGMANFKEINECLNYIKKFHKKIILLHCVSGYPTPENQANLKRILALKKRFKDIKIGLSDHTDDIVTSLAAISFEVPLIEKHFILSKKYKSPDAKFSINPGQLKILSNYSKKIYSALGKENLDIQKAELKSKKFRRSIFSIKNIQKGEKFSKKNISTFRPCVGIGAKYFFNVIGKKAKKNIKAFLPIYKNCLAN